MPYPAPYTRQANYTSFEQSNPTTPKPGSDLDADFDAVKTSMDESQDALADVRRADGALVNGIVTPDSLSLSTLLMLGDWVLRGEWVTATVYAELDVISKVGKLYVSLAAHTSGTFAVDLAAGKWAALFLSVAAADVTYTPAGDIAATDVQAAITELDTEKQPKDASLTAYAALTTAANKYIYFTAADTPATADITANARSLLAAADYTAMKVLLALTIGTNVQAYDAATAKLDVNQTWTKGNAITPGALTDGANIATNAAQSNSFRVTLAGNRTLDNPTNMKDGQSLTFRITQDATGSRTLAYGTKFKFTGGAAPTLSTAAGRVDILSCIYFADTDIIACSITKDVR
jgi:hypothetical protein